MTSMAASKTRHFQALQAALARAPGAYETREEPDIGKLTKTIEGIAAAVEGFERRYADKLERLETRMSRPGAGSSDALQEAPIPADERKALEVALRKWVAGDQVGFDRAMSEVKGLRVGADSDGGYFVPTAVGPMVRIMADVSPLVGQVGLITLREGSALEGISDLSQFGASWVGEEQARPETDTGDVGKHRIELQELCTMPTVTQKLIDTAEIDVVSWATSKIYEAFAVKEEAAFISGDGILKPRGFATYTTAATADSARTWGVLEHVATGQSADFAASNPADCLIELSLKLKAQYRPNARWLMSRTVATKIRKLKEATTNGYLWQPGLQQGQPDMLLGFPVTYCEAMPALGANSLSIAFGDFRQAYTSIRKAGVKLLTDPYTNKPKVNLFAYARVGGDVTNFEAMKLLKFGSS